MSVHSDVTKALVAAEKFLTDHPIPLAGKPAHALEFNRLVSSLRAAVCEHGLNGDDERKSLADESQKMREYMVAVAAEEKYHMNVNSVPPPSPPCPPAKELEALLTSEASGVTNEQQKEKIAELKKAFQHPQTHGPSVARAMYGTCGTSATVRTCVWNLFITEPFLTALYTVGVTDAQAQAKVQARGEAAEIKKRAEDKARAKEKRPGASSGSLRPQESAASFNSSFGGFGGSSLYVAADSDASAAGPGDGADCDAAAAEPAAAPSAELARAGAYLNCRTNADDYLALLARGPSPQYQLIRDDSFRTFNTVYASANPKDPVPQDDSNIFPHVVPEQATVRLCTAFDHKFGGLLAYCQGMNVYAGMFLLALPELDAFNAFALFCTQYIPLYWQANHIGAEAGCKLVDDLLMTHEPKLFTLLSGHVPSLNAQLYGFPCVKTMSAFVPPVHEAAALWDRIFAVGPALSLYCVIAQLQMMDLSGDGADIKSMLDYRKWPRLDAKKVADRAIKLLKSGKTPSELARNIVLHFADNTIMKNLTGRSNWLMGLKVAHDNL